MSSPRAVHFPPLAFKFRPQFRPHLRRWRALSLLALAVAASPSGRAQAASCPSLTILLERSDGMLLDLTNSPDIPQESKQRWGIAKAAIARAVAAYNNRLPIGLTFFPSDDTCGSEGALRVPPAYGTKAAIMTALADGSFAPDGGGTPTCGAVGKAAQALGSESRASYLLLITAGLPSCDATCSVDPRDPAGSAVKAVAAAVRGTHPVKTFVLAIGSQDAISADGLTRMAAAGGVPDTNDPNLKFFAADDVTALDSALQRIMRQLTSDDAGVTCDDSCTKNGCGSASQVCVQGHCLLNPCLALACRVGEYCLSTGTAAKCVSPCDKSCTTGSHCHLGVCVHEACGEPCEPGTKCQAAPGTDGIPGVCVPDPACATVTCGPNQGCFAGACQDDPCQYTTCPAGLACLSFDGSCVSKGYSPSERAADDHLAAGCTISARTSGTTALPAAGLFAAGLLTLFRRRRLGARQLLHRARI